MGVRAPDVRGRVVTRTVSLGSIITATNVLDFGDLMILGMAFPNVLGVFLLSGKVRAALREYTTSLRSGEIRRHG